MAWDMKNRKSDTDVAETTLERARKRLRVNTPIRQDDTWHLPGLEQFGDAYGEYELTTDGEGLWYCSCYNHYGGEFRQEKVCSHSAAVALYAGLPCQRTRALSEKPKRPTPDRPCDIPGIPPQYTTWRPYQRETVEWLVEQLNNSSKFIALDAPTGSGKSLSAIAAAKLAKSQTPNKKKREV